MHIYGIQKNGPDEPICRFITLPPSHPSQPSQGTELSPLCCASSHQLSISHMVVYTCQCHSFCLSRPLLLPLYPQVCLLYLSLFLPCKQIQPGLDLSHLSTDLQHLPKNWESLVALTIKTPHVMQETWVQFLGQEDPLEKEMATLSSILAWRIPRKEETGGLQSMESQRVRHN